MLAKYWDPPFPAMLALMPNKQTRPSADVLARREGCRQQGGVVSEGGWEVLEGLAIGLDAPIGGAQL